MKQVYKITLLLICLLICIFGVQAATYDDYMMKLEELKERSANCSPDDGEELLQIMNGIETILHDAPQDWRDENITYRQMYQLMIDVSEIGGELPSIIEIGQKDTTF